MIIMSRRSLIAGLGSALAVSPTAVLAQQRKVTPTTDLGPFYPLIRPKDEDHDLTMIGGSRRRAAGQVIEVTGRVLNRLGRPVPGARIEIWQANAAGRYAHPGDSNPNKLDPDFQGFGKLTSGRDGRYRYVTIKPGAYPDGDDSPRPPHIHLDISGAKDRIVTQMLFPDEPLNAGDDVLKGFPLDRLIARAMGGGGGGVQRFEWDVVLDNG